MQKVGITERGDHKHVKIFPMFCVQRDFQPVAFQW